MKMRWLSWPDCKEFSSLNCLLHKTTYLNVSLKFSARISMIFKRVLWRERTLFQVLWVIKPNSCNLQNDINHWIARPENKSSRTLQTNPSVWTRSVHQVNMKNPVGETISRSPGCHMLLTRCLFSVPAIISLSMGRALRGTGERVVLPLCSVN